MKNMGILGRIKGIFGRKKVEPPPIEDIGPDLGPPPVTRPEGTLPPIPREALMRREEPFAPSPFGMPEPRFPEAERVDMTNIRAKLDLLITEMDSIKTQNQTINERLRTIEKMLAEMRGIRYY